ncbi:hypothetical protein [Spirulina sp. 06S082]|uniref:hypothetical protein n=1 Tax=Spirulina sp. 06S082 TaxID=3110248 RepID=UPI002B21A4F4|nr:hypothetical protein [Spirulina sp. 06S082]MEA5470569.1 hypothetical protein [Spirulina sp. 06S082]
MNTANLTPLPNFSSNFVKNQNETRINETELTELLFKQCILRKLQLSKSQDHLVTNYGTNIMSSGFETETRLNTSTYSNYMELESVEFRQNQTEFDWSKNTNPFDRISHLRDLQENWDNYGAPSFSEQQINRAIRIYLQFLDYSFSQQDNYLDIRPFVAPSSDGSILLEWGGNRFPIRQLELYIPADLESDLQYLKSSAIDDEEGDINENKLSVLFSWLFTESR